MKVSELNKDVEKYILGAEGLTFVHFSDVHAREDLWNRIAEYINDYSDKIAFGLHTGDFCGGSQEEYSDLYAKNKCVRPIYNCVGNHDCFSGGKRWTLSEKELPHRLLFNRTEGWDVSFSECTYSMSYYKDLGDIRLIVLDDYYDIWQTRVWLRRILKDALDRSLHVITAQHEPTHYISDTYGASFQTLDDYNERFRQYELNRTEYDFDHRCRVLYEDVIAEFIRLGGTYICNLAGHDHVDEFGLTASGVLNVVVQNATSWDGLGDTDRVKGGRSEDCFNVMSVDTESGAFTLVRVGACTDRHGRTKKMLKFDYVNKRILAEE